MPNEERSSAELWLALKYIPRLALHKKFKLVEAIGLNKLFFHPPSLSAFNLTAKQISAIHSPDWDKISEIIAASERCNSTLIHYSHVNYPSLLKEIDDPPLVLFIEGDDRLLNQAQIAIVGSRNSTAAGREIAKEFANTLSGKGITINSGLAIGIDAYAHLGAFEQLGSTVAVIATGLDITYPHRHKKLRQDIVRAGGCIVSEFVPGTPPRAGHFPKRNRIISGMSLGVVVIEAALKSGTLITARMAMEQNREVFAVPSSIRNSNASGCHWLIKQGAKLVENCADIMEELESSIGSSLHLKEESTEVWLTEKKKDSTNENQDLFINSLLASVDYEITPVDVVVSRNKLSTSEVLTQLTMLELKGLVTAVPGGYIRL